MSEREREFTPGPWQWFNAWRDDFGMLRSYRLAGEQGGETILAASGGDDVVISTEANARLVAAAPCLLEALEQLLHAVCGETGFANAVRTDSGLAYPWPALDEAEAKARAAIARATRSAG